ncbi:MAG: histidine phosphatase family protein [Actinomyces sp.]|nr:MAG: histidine phosphatase family protein [Actinomyces sp.]
MTRILVVRHGQSEWNAEKRWQGQADPPLSPLGVEQARAAARRVGGVDLVVASDLERARHTAEIIADEIGVGPVIVDEGFRERGAGEWQGLTRDEIEDRYPGHLDEGRRPPGWEPEDTFRVRVLDALERARARAAGGEVLVVAHGGVVYTLEAHLGAPFERIANLAGRWFVHGDGGWELGERIHLAPEVAPAPPDLL